MSSLVDLVLLFQFKMISRWIIGKLIFCKYMKNLRLKRNITWGNVCKSPFGRDNVTFYILLCIFPKNIDFSSIFPSCSHQVNCTHWTKWYFTDFPYLLLANQWRPKIWEGPTRRLWRWYVDLFSKKHFPIWKNVHNWLCHLFPSWTLPCIALCKRARLKLEDAKIGPDLPIILTDTRGIANTFSTPWIWIHGTWNVNETIKA